MTKCIFNFSVHLLDRSSEIAVFYSLIDILYGYAYDMRQTEGEHSVSYSEFLCINLYNCINMF